MVLVACKDNGHGSAMPVREYSMQTQIFDAKRGILQHAPFLVWLACAIGNLTNITSRDPATVRPIPAV